METLINRLLQLISENKIDDFFREINAALSANAALQSEIILQQSRFTNIQRKIRSNTVSIAEADIEMNRIRDAIITITNTITESDLGQGGHGLEEKIRSLSLAKNRIGVLYTVNCDRSDLADLFWDRFDEKEEAKLHFYFIPAEPKQMPPSFAERMIFEILQDELDDELEAISLEKRSDGLRLNIADFEIKNNLKRTQRAFEKYFCKRFQEHDFEHVIQHKLAKLEYTYIASIFKLELREWKDFMPEFLQWVIDRFRAVPSENESKFLFFIVINMEGFIDQPKGAEQERILAEIRAVLEKNEDACSKLKGLAPVPENDIESWFRDVGEQNPNKIEEVLQTYVSSLSDKVQSSYQSSGKLDMAMMEELQQKVYEIANE
ncbi:MAG: hypothetical protein AAF849_20775 [Bacteroidota bacterium]